MFPTNSNPYKKYKYIFTITQFDAENVFYGTLTKLFHIDHSVIVGTLWYYMVMMTMKYRKK